jgi:alkyl hydroperoxide reductase subunit AhpC
MDWSHLKWKDIEEVQNVTLQYPIIADEKRWWLIYDPMQMVINLQRSRFYNRTGSKIDSYLSGIYW